MTTTTTTTNRPVAIIHFPAAKVPSLIQLAQGIITAMTGNPAFPTPTPSLATVTAATNALSTAETEAQTRAKGAVAVRNDKRLTLVELVQELRGYVQAVADANPATAAAIIESAGMALRKKPTRAARAFGIRQGPVSGTALVRAPAAARTASYEWQYSINGGQTWITAPPTIQAHTSITGLGAPAVLEVKYRAVTRKGAGDWSAPVALTVL